MATSRSHWRPGINLARLASLDLEIEGPGSLLALDQVAVWKWQYVLELEPWQAVLLHSGVDPDTAECVDRLPQMFSPLALAFLGYGKEGMSDAEVRVFQLQSNYEQVQRALVDGKLGPVPDNVKSFRHQMISRSSFLDWSDEVNLPTVGPWPHRGHQEARWWLRFPHVTTHLLRLERAAQEIWTEGRSQAPTRAEVAEHMMRMVNGPSRSLANAMATILRPDDQPRGRPPKVSSPSKCQSSAEEKQAGVTAPRNR